MRWKCRNLTFVLVIRPKSSHIEIKYCSSAVPRVRDASLSSEATSTLSHVMKKKSDKPTLTTQVYKISSSSIPISSWTFFVCENLKLQTLRKALPLAPAHEIETLTEEVSARVLNVFLKKLFSILLSTPELLSLLVSRGTRQLSTAQPHPTSTLQKQTHISKV